tara:strand:+ start:14 stop:547 length:534 start_codon:yes stop_codon:yes gene_type:complete
MGLFNFFKKNNEQIDVLENLPTEDQFIDNTEPNETIGIKNTIFTLNDILEYASIDFEIRGYQDSLINPDSSYKNDNTELLLLDLGILINKSENYYTNYLKNLNFHIQSRKDAGLIDTVMQLETENDKITESLNQVLKIKNDTNTDKGLYKRISLSYNRGFNRGLASMSNELLKANTL